MRRESSGLREAPPPRGGEAARRQLNLDQERAVRAAVQSALRARDAAFDDFDERADGPRDGRLLA